MTRNPIYEFEIGINYKNKNKDIVTVISYLFIYLEIIPECFLMTLFIGKQKCCCLKIHLLKGE